MSRERGGGEGGEGEGGEGEERGGARDVEEHTHYRVPGTSVKCTD